MIVRGKKENVAFNVIKTLWWENMHILSAVYLLNTGRPLERKDTSFSFLNFDVPLSQQLSWINHALALFDYFPQLFQRYSYQGLQTFCNADMKATYCDGIQINYKSRNWKSNLLLLMFIEYWKSLIQYIDTI